MAITAGAVWNVLTNKEKGMVTREGSFAKWVSELYSRLDYEGTINPDLDALTLAIANSGVVTEGTLYHVAMLILNGSHEPTKIALINLLATEGLLSASTQATALAL